MSRTLSDIFHDMAISLLPKVLEEMNIPCVITDDDGNQKINARQITDIYDDLCRDFNAARCQKYNEMKAKEE